MVHVLPSDDSSLLNDAEDDHSLNPHAEGKRPDHSSYISVRTCRGPNPVSVLRSRDKRFDHLTRCNKLCEDKKKYLVLRRIMLD